MSWRLTVEYPTLGEGAYYWGTLDSDIVGAAGKLESGRGTRPVDGVRFLSFSFSSESAARNARKRVLGLRRRGVKTVVGRFPLVGG